MRVEFRYHGRSSVVPQGDARALVFAPNLVRPRVFFDGALRNAVRFREAISALHDVVVGDLRMAKKDRTAWEEWKKQQAAAEEELRRQVRRAAKQEELDRMGRDAPPADLEPRFQKAHEKYWRARRRWANELALLDPELFRHLVPCDPVVTVAPDVVFFECFAKDESSYGCLSVDRDAFLCAQDAELGTTNVDYSLPLYEHFQTLRSYRPTRLLVDPSGFEVKVAGSAALREEKIDLPSSWLRGFGQLQAAMGLPSRRIVLPVEAVYSVLAFLARHREKAGPRSIRFELVPGRPPVIVLDPWGVRIATHGEPWDGAKPEEVKIWGRRRLLLLARLLPLVEKFEVALLGSGLPSVFVAHMGEMRFTLALSGWTANDWSSGSNLDLLSGAVHVDPELVSRIGAYLEEESLATLAELVAATKAHESMVVAALTRLARQGQVVHDFARGLHRHRPVLAEPLTDAALGPENPELAEGRRIHAEKKVKIARREAVDGGRTLLVAKAENTSCEAILDPDGRFSRAKCSCSHFHKSRLRAGPCRHLLALRFEAHGVPVLIPPSASALIN